MSFFHTNSYSFLYVNFKVITRFSSYEMFEGTLDVRVIQDGVYIKGLYLQGAGWDKKNSLLVEADPMQLVCAMPSILFKPTEVKKKSSKGEYKRFDVAPDGSAAIRG